MDDPTPPAAVNAERERSPRRRFLITGTAAAVGAAGAARAAGYEVPADATKVQGYPMEDTSYGTRSQFETEVRTRYKTATAQSSWTMTPLQDSVGIITPSGLHFERSHGGTAVIDPAKHMLYVHGMVKQARKFTMKDLRRFPALSRIMFIECSGNGLTEWSKPTLKTVQGTHGLTSCSEWTGVPLATVLHEAGLRTDAKWLLAEGGDASAMTRSIPMEKALKDCLVAYGQIAGHLASGDVAERTVTLFALAQGLLQMHKQSRYAPAILDVEHLLVQGTRALLVGWGAKAKNLDAAIDDVAALGDLTTRAGDAP